MEEDLCLGRFKRRLLYVLRGELEGNLAENFLLSDTFLLSELRRGEEYEEEEEGEADDRGKNFVSEISGVWSKPEAGADRDSAAFCAPFFSGSSSSLPKVLEYSKLLLSLKKPYFFLPFLFFLGTTSFLGSFSSSPEAFSTPTLFPAEVALDRRRWWALGG